jgi:hypothetical protein
VTRTTLRIAVGGSCGIEASRHLCFRPVGVSEPAGRSVATIAGEEIKKVVLELGGSDPFIVMPSTDLERATDIAVRARTLNNGQSCINGTRFFVHADIYDAFLDLFAAKMGALVVGDPMDDATDIGPLATESGRADVDAYVQDALAKGATALVGGHKPDSPGWFYPPTVLTGITPEMKMYAEEVFGPVAQVFSVSSLAKPSTSPTPIPTAWAPTSGARTTPSATCSSATCNPAWRSSMATPPAIPRSPLAESNSADTDVNSPTSACASS